MLKRILLASQEKGGKVSYFPCPIFRSTDDFSITLQGGSKTFDQDVFLVGIHMYPFEAYDNWLTIEYPNGEKGEKYGLYDNESTYPFIFLPAGTKVIAHNCTINWFYVTWVKVPEMVSGGGSPSEVSHAADLENHEVAA